jgi:hypothetical protein
MVSGGARIGGYGALLSFFLLPPLLSFSSFLKFSPFFFFLLKICRKIWRIFMGARVAGDSSPPHPLDAEPFRPTIIHVFPSPLREN